MGDTAQSLSDTAEMEWVSSVCDIPEAEWNACFDDDIRNSYQFVRAVAESHVPGAELTYLLMRRQGSIEAIVPCYVQTMPLDIIATDRFHAACSFIRKFLPRFLMVRVFFAGLPVATCKRSLGLQRVSEGVRYLVISKLAQATRARARELGANLVVVKDLAGSDSDIADALQAQNFRVVASLPVAVVHLDPVGGVSYVDRLRNHYRSVYRGRRKRFDRGNLSWELMPCFADQASILYELYRNVQRRLRTVQQLPESIFERLPERLGSRTFALVARSPDERIVGFTIVLECGPRLYPMYLGFDYSLRDECAIYYNILYRSIEEAEKRGCEAVILGQTAYASKGLLGAVLEDLNLAVSPESKWVRVMLALFGEKLFPKITAPKHNVFREVLAPER